MDDGYDFGEAVREAMRQGYKSGGRIGFANGRRVDDRVAKIVDKHILERSSKIAGTKQYQVEIPYVDPKLLKEFGYEGKRQSFTKKYTKAFNTLKEAQNHRDKVAYPKLAKQLNVSIDFFTEPSKAKTFSRLAKEFLPSNKKNYITGAELAKIMGERDKFVAKGGNQFRSSFIKALVKLLDQTDVSKLGFDPLGRGLPFYMYKKPTKDDIKLLRKYQTQQANKLSKGTGYNFIYPETVARIKILDKSPFFKNFINSKQVITKEMIEDSKSPLNKFMSKNNMTLNQFLRAAMRYGEALRGDFMINLTDPLLSDQSIKVNKNFSNKIYNKITDSISTGINDPIKTAIYRSAMSDISDQLGQQTTTFENYKTYLRNRVSKLVKPRKNIETKLRGKGVTKTGVDVDEIIGVSTSARNKTAPYAVFSRFIAAELNQGQLNAFQNALSNRTSLLREAIAKNDMKKANKIVKDFETEIYKPYSAKLKAAGVKNVGLPKLTLKAPTSKILGGGKGRLEQLKKQGLDFEDFYKREKFGYVLPEGSLTQKEILSMDSNDLKKFIRQSGFDVNDLITVKKYAKQKTGTTLNSFAGFIDFANSGIELPPAVRQAVARVARVGGQILKGTGVGAAVLDPIFAAVDFSEAIDRGVGGKEAAKYTGKRFVEGVLNLPDLVASGAKFAKDKAQGKDTEFKTGTLYEPFTFAQESLDRAEAATPKATRLRNIAQRDFDTQVRPGMTMVDDMEIPASQEQIKAAEQEFIKNKMGPYYKYGLESMVEEEPKEKPLQDEGILDILTNPIYKGGVIKT
jgi:hypothetical protein